MNRVLSLDLGTKLGHYYTGDTAHTYNLGKGDDRFFNFGMWLQKEIKDKNIDTVVYEKAAFQQGNAIPIYHGLVGVLKHVCISYTINYESIPVGTIKKAFTGNGRANKKEMMAMCDKMGIKYDDDNSADAYAVAYTYKEVKNG